VKSKILHAIDDPQPGLPLVRKDQAVDHRVIAAQKTMLNAIRLCISVAGFEAEKQLYAELGIDAGHWSRIMRGEAHFPVDKLLRLMDLCGNEVPLLWLAHARNYDMASLRLRECELERQLRESREEAAALRRALIQPVVA